MKALMAEVNLPDRYPRSSRPIEERGARITNEDRRIARHFGKPLVIENLALPRLSKGQVLIGMQLSAVCHSQKLEVAGRRGPDPYLPHLVSHEGVGVVADVGPGVRK